MTAAERATALQAGEPAECPACCRVTLQRDGAHVRCTACPWRSSVALAGLVGHEGDPTAALWLLDGGPRR